MLHMKKKIFFICTSSFIFILSGCYNMRGSNGGGQISTTPARKINSSDVALPPGYTIEVVATGLNFPTGVTFDNDGRIYIIEAGYSYGEVWAEPRLLRIENNGNTTTIAKGT